MRFAFLFLAGCAGVVEVDADVSTFGRDEVECYAEVVEIDVPPMAVFNVVQCNDAGTCDHRETWSVDGQVYSKCNGLLVVTWVAPALGMFD